MYNDLFKFSIKQDGKLTAYFDFDFNQHVDNPWDTRIDSGPFMGQDFSTFHSNAAKRARRLAKPEWDFETGRTREQLHELIEEARLLNETIDFSFKHRYTGKGKWQ